MFQKTGVLFQDLTLLFQKTGVLFQDLTLLFQDPYLAFHVPVKWVCVISENGRWCADTDLFQANVKLYRFVPRFWKLWNTANPSPVRLSAILFQCSTILERTYPPEHIFRNSASFRIATADATNSLCKVMSYLKSMEHWNIYKHIYYIIIEREPKLQWNQGLACLGVWGFGIESRGIFDS